MAQEMSDIVRAVREGAGVEEEKEGLFTVAGVEGATGGGSETLRSDYFIQPALITNLGLQEVESTRRKVGGQALGITTAEVMGKLYREDGEQTPSLFHPPSRHPTVRVSRRSS